MHNLLSLSAAGAILLCAACATRPPLHPVSLETPENPPQTDVAQSKRWLVHIKDARPETEKSGSQKLGGLTLERLGDKQFSPGILYQLDKLLADKVAIKPREKLVINNVDILHAYDMNQLDNFAAVHRQLDYLIPLLHRSTPQELPQFLSCRIKGKFRSRYFEIIVAEKFDAPGFLDSLDHTEQQLANLVKQCLDKTITKIKKNCDC